MWLLGGWFDQYQAYPKPLERDSSAGGIHSSGDWDGFSDAAQAQQLSRQNGRAVALRELGRVERSVLTFDWLNKGEARNALTRAVFFHRPGEMRDRSFENQRHRASGLTLVTAAIALWNS